MVFTSVMSRNHQRQSSEGNLLPYFTPGIYFHEFFISQLTAHKCEQEYQLAGNTV